MLAKSRIAALQARLPEGDGRPTEGLEEVPEADVSRFDRTMDMTSQVLHCSTTAHTIALLLFTPLLCYCLHHYSATVYTITLLLLTSSNVTLVVTD